MSGGRELYQVSVGKQENDYAVIHSKHLSKIIFKFSIKCIFIENYSVIANKNKWGFNKNNLRLPGTLRLSGTITDFGTYGTIWFQPFPEVFESS